MLALGLLASAVIAYTFSGEFGAKISYSDTGAGFPVVFLHGFPVNKHMWHNQEAYLMSQYRVLAMDLRGFGNSTLDDDQFMIETMADDVIALLDHLKLRQAVIVGFSMGGFVALRVAERNPERVQSLVLIDTSSKAPSDNGKIGTADELIQVKTKGLYDYSVSFAHEALCNATLISRPEITQFLVDMSTGASIKGVGGALIAMAARSDTTEALASFKAPVLILVGDQDQILPLEDSKLMLSKLPQAKFAIIPGAGHFTPVENAAVVNSQLGSFLSEQVLIQ